MTKDKPPFIGLAILIAYGAWSWHAYIDEYPTWLPIGILVIAIVTAPILALRGNNPSRAKTICMMAAIYAMTLTGVVGATTVVMDAYAGKQPHPGAVIGAVIFGFALGYVLEPFLAPRRSPWAR